LADYQELVGQEVSEEDFLRAIQSGTDRAAYEVLRKYREEGEGWADLDTVVSFYATYFSLQDLDALYSAESMLTREEAVAIFAESLYDDLDRFIRAYVQDYGEDLTAATAALVDGTLGVFYPDDLRLLLSALEPQTLYPLLEQYREGIVEPIELELGPAEARMQLDKYARNTWKSMPESFYSELAGSTFPVLWEWYSRAKYEGTFEEFLRDDEYNAGVALTTQALRIKKSNRDVFALALARQATKLGVSMVDALDALQSSGLTPVLQQLWVDWTPPSGTPYTVENFWNDAIAGTSIEVSFKQVADAIVSGQRSRQLEARQDAALEGYGEVMGFRQYVAMYVKEPKRRAEVLDWFDTFFDSFRAEMLLEGKQYDSLEAFVRGFMSYIEELGGPALIMSLAPDLRRLHLVRWERPIA
jgi:hypothetical protein